MSPFIWIGLACIAAAGFMVAAWAEQDPPPPPALWIDPPEGDGTP